VTVTIPPPPERDYAPVPNATLRDHALTYAEKGMLAYIRSHAAHYALTMEQIIGESADGSDAVRSILRSLEAKRYLRRTPVRGYRGRIERYDYELTDPDEALTASGRTASGETACRPTASGQAATSGDQAKQGVSAAPTACRLTASGQPEAKNTNTPTGKKTREKTREPSTSSRGTRLPEDWKPTDEIMAWFLAEHVEGGRWSEGSREALRREHANFMDYWHAAAGAKATKKRWDLTWRTWMRRAFPRPIPSSGTVAAPARQSFAEQDRARRAEGDAKAAAADALMEQHPGMTAREAMAIVDEEIAKRLDGRTAHPYIDGEYRDPDQRPEVTQ